MLKVEGGADQPASSRLRVTIFSSRLLGLTIQAHKACCISGWIFQKVLAKIVQKSLILSQKGLISNRHNFNLFAPKSMHFLSKDRKSKDLSF